ncbi:MAG TPA: aldose 1-epimerase family protein [Jatrophihabitans sp.]|nr:aldose 1-epimerase family protein [Jatrophihabitans sp.]
MALSGELFSIAAGGYRAEVAEVGAALAGLWLADRPITVDADPDQLPPKSSGAVLAPWPNRIRDGRYRFDETGFQLPLTEPAAGNASHGLVKWVRWACQDRHPDRLTLVHELVPQTGYPFELRLELRYALDPVTGLSVRLTAHNTGRQAAPFGAGFHPYLDLAGHPLDSTELLIPADTVLLTDSQQIPVRREPVAGTSFDFRSIRPIGADRLDHGFTDLTGRAAVLRTPDRTVELHWDARFSHLQVFTPPFITPGRTAVAIEPMSCAADAFNSGDGLVRLAPGQSWSAGWRIAVTSGSVGG